MTELLEGISSTATAIGVGIAAWQLWRARVQARTDFEDQLAREYREVARQIPVDALLGSELDPGQIKVSMAAILSYIDLSNEQVFLRKRNRIRKDTWLQWRDGIRGLLRKPVIRAAWEEIKDRSKDSFSELQKLEASGFELDPLTFRDH